MFKIESEKVACNRCGDMVKPGDIYWVQDEPMCQECFDELARYCDQCEEPFDLDDMYRSVHGEWFCKECKDELLDKCVFCEELFFKEELRECHGIDGGVCAECVVDQGLKAMP